MIRSLGISQRDRRTLVIGIASVGTIVATGKGGPALRQWEATRVAAAVDARTQLLAAERGATSLTQVRDSASARSQRLDTLRRVLLRASTPDAAAARLASAVERIAMRHDVDVLTVALMPDSIVRSRFARATVRLSVETDVAGLMDLLFEIEAAKLPLLISGLWATQSEPAAPTSKVETLRIELDIQTLVRVDTASGTKESRR